MATVYLLLGSNLGERDDNMKKALKLVERDCGKVIKQSHNYETEAWGLKEQNRFLNCAVLIETALTPMLLLNALKHIEFECGRTETVKWGPRIIDIDILFYDEEIIREPGLVIPHPLLQERRFTLVPLNEIAAGFIHPVFKKTIGELLEECKDELDVKRV